MAVHGSGEYLRGGSSQHGCLLVTLHPPGLLSFDPDDRHFPRIFFYHPTLRLPSIFSSFFYSMSFLFLVYSLALVKKHSVVSSKWMRCKFWSPGVSQNIFILFSCLVNCLAEFRGLLKTWLHCFLFFGHLASSIAAEKSKAIWFLFFFSSVFFSFEIIKNHVVVFHFLPCLFNLSGWEQFCLIFLFLFHHVDVFKKLGQLSCSLTVCIHLIVFSRLDSA